MCANCKEFSNYLFPFENMSDDKFTVEFRTASTSYNAAFDAKQLNNLFYSGTADDDDVFVGLGSNNKREPYLESNQTTLLSYDGSLKNTFSMLYVNIRSLINPLNFSKLESLLASLKLQPDIIAQGWPTSQMPRAAFLAVFQQRAISYTQGIMIALALPYLLLMHMLCLARLIVYRLVSSVCNGIAIGAGGLAFVARAVWVKVNKVSPPLQYFFKFEAVLPKVLKLYGL